MKYPRSAYDKTGGILYFARMLDKIRLHAAGELPVDYHQNLGKGFDGLTLNYLHVEYSKLVERVKQDGSDEEIFQWCAEQGRRLNADEIRVLNGFMMKRGDNDDSTESLEKYKKGSNLDHRKDLKTWFEYYEVDEKRKP